MPNAFKNERDPPPLIAIDLLTGAPANAPLPGPRYYRVEWATDLALFTTPAARTADSFFPLGPNDGIQISFLRAFTVSLEVTAWNRLRAARHIYYRIGLGTQADMTGWAWSAPRDYQINHMPHADAGTPQRLELGPGGVVASAVSLVSSGSTDPDAGSVLTSVWELAAPPAGVFHPTFLFELRDHLAQGGAQPTVFPAGLAVPEGCEGAFRFRLRVRDDDPPSIRYGTIGEDTAETTITIFSCPTRICIEAPTGAQPRALTRPDPVGVEISWSMDAALRQSGRRVQLRIFTTGAPPGTSPVYSEIDFAPGTRGLFVWSGNRADGQPAGTGAYDIRIELLDPSGQPLALPGYTTRATEVGAIALDAFTARIQRSLTPTDWSLGVPANFVYEVHAPAPLEALAITLTGPAPTTLQIPPNALNGSVSWTPSAPGEYRATLEARRGGAVVASDEHELFVLDDPLATRFPVGEALYDASPASDPFVPAADKMISFPPGDGYPVPRTVEIRALVRYPAAVAGAGAPFHPAVSTCPLVLIVHGNHQATLSPGGPPTESYRGFDYLARHLGARGYIAASLDMDALNGPFPPLGVAPTGHTIAYRAQTILAHIARWRAKNMSDPLFAGRVDLSHIGLVGHSRGGEAVVEATRLGSPHGTIAGVTSMSPTDNLGNVHSGCPYLVTYGSVDGDVITADPFKLYDRALRPKAQVYVYGATHNDFVDHADWLTERTGGMGGILPRPVVLATAGAFVCSFMDWSLRGRREQSRFLDHGLMPRSLVALAPLLRCVKSLASDNFFPIDSFTTPPIMTTDTGLTVTTLGAPVSPFSEQGFRWSESVTTDPTTGIRTLAVIPQSTPFFQQDTAAGYVGWAQNAVYLIGLGALDVSSYRSISFRVAQALSPAVPFPYEPKNPLGTAKNLRVGLKDTQGNFAALEFSQFAQEPPYPWRRDDDRTPKNPWSRGSAIAATTSAFATAHLPLWAFARKEPQLDLTSLSQLMLFLDGTGLIGLDDIELTR